MRKIDQHSKQRSNGPVPVDRESGVVIVSFNIAACLFSDRVRETVEREMRFS